LKDRKVKGKIESSCSFDLKNKMMNHSKLFHGYCQNGPIPVNVLFAIVVTKSSSFCFPNLLKATP